MELNFKEDLQKLDSDHAKLFYLIFFFYKHNNLNWKQKSKLKSLIIAENEKIFNLLDEFEKTNNEKKLLKDFINLSKSRGPGEVHIETPKKKNKCDYSFSQKIKKNILKNSCDSSTKINGSKLSVVGGDKSFLNKTTIPSDLKTKSRFAKMADYKIEVKLFKNK